MLVFSTFVKTVDKKKCSNYSIMRDNKNFDLYGLLCKTCTALAAIDKVLDYKDINWCAKNACRMLGIVND